MKKRDYFSLKKKNKSLKIIYLMNIYKYIYKSYFWLKNVADIIIFYKFNILHFIIFLSFEILIFMRMK